VKYFYLFVIILIACASCKKPVGEYYLTAEEKAQIPFKGYETFTFINDNNNTYSVTGEGRINQTYESPECINCRDYSIFERDWVYFNNDSYRISLVQNSGRTKHYFTIGFVTYGVDFEGSFISPLSRESLKENEVFIDSLFLNNRMYHNIYSDTLTHIGMIEFDPYPVRIYYSTEFGVVKFDFSDGSSWELESINWGE